MLAQLPVDSTWVALFGQVGVVTALIWYLWYRTAVTDPKRDEAMREHGKELTETFTTTVDKITERHDESIREVVVEFSANLREEREARRVDLATLKDSLRCRATTPGMGS